MKKQQPIQDNKTNNKLEEIELQSFKSAYVIPSSLKCFISSEEIARVGKVFDLVDFSNDGGIKYRRISFLRAYLNGYTLIFVLLDIKARKILNRSQRIDNDVCDFVIMDTDVFEPKHNSD